MTKPTNTPDFNDQAVDFSTFAVPTVGETAGIVGEQVAAKTSKAARMLALATALGLTATTTISFGDDDPIKPITKPEEPKLTDTPENKAAFMADVKPAVLGGGVATMEYDAVWKGDRYELQPKSMVNVAKAIESLEHYANSNNKSKESLVFNIYYRSSSTRISWIIPFNDMKSYKEIININESSFDKFIVKNEIMPNGGNPNASVKRWESGFISMNIGQFNSGVSLQVLAEINPFYFGK